MVRSLQQRLVLFLLLPVSLLLFSVGLGGFLYARNAMLNEWRKASILKLQRAAHYAFRWPYFGAMALFLIRKWST